MEAAIVRRREKLSVGFNQNKVIILLTCLLIPLLTFISPASAIVFIYAFGFFLLLKSDYKFLIFFTCFIFVQNILLVLCANKFTPTTNTLYSLSKEIMLYAFCLKSLFVVKDRKAKCFIVIIAALYILLNVVSFFRSDAEFMSKVISIRQLFLPFVCFFFGYFLEIDEKKKKRLFDLIVVLSIITAIMGFFDFFIFKDTIWSKLPFDVYQANKGAEFDLYHGVPLNFYTWDFTDVFGVVVRRLVSIQADPLTTAHFLFLGFVLTSFSNLKHKKIIKWILFLAAMLTFSKGVYIGFLVYFVLMILKRLSYKQFRNLFIIAVVVAIALFSTAVSIISKVAPNSSIMIHIRGLLNGFVNTSLFGYGVGKAGVMVSIKTGIERLTGESYIGIVLAQLGIVGFLLYLVFTVCLIFRLYYFYSTYNKKDVFIPICLLLAVFLESFFSESSVGLVATGLYFVLAGQSFATFNKKKKVYKVVTSKEKNKEVQAA